MQVLHHANRAHAQRGRLWYAVPVRGGFCSQGYQGLQHTRHQVSGRRDSLLSSCLSTKRAIFAQTDF